MGSSKPDIWRDIEGYGGKYQASYTGEIRRVCRSGKTRLLTPYKRSRRSRAGKITRDRLYIRLTDSSGKRKEVPVLKIIAQTFLPPPKKGEVPYHLNGIVTDNWASNIGFIDRKTLGQKTGYISRAQPVIKIDRAGGIVEAYRSAREAAERCFMSRQTITDRCNGCYKKGGKTYKFKSVFAPDGFAYSWDDDRHIKKTLVRMRDELSSSQIIASLNGYDAEPEPEPQMNAGGIECRSAAN